MNYPAKKHYFITTFLLLCLIYFSSFSKKEVYNAIKNKNNTQIESLLTQIQKSNSLDKEAYYAASLMFHAQFLKEPKSRLEQFKKGKNLLENAILKNEAAYEYRFLRLMIQEHAPAILKYNNNIEEDIKVIKNNFTKIPENIQKCIEDYAKISKNLKP